MLWILDKSFYFGFNEYYLTHVGSKKSEKAEFVKMTIFAAVCVVCVCYLCVYVVKRNTNNDTRTHAHSHTHTQAHKSEHRGTTT